jgi:GH24 family phage-related lysozyme (muramidase)
VNTSQKGIDFIKGNEGYTPNPKDDNGHLMWGHGHDRVGFEPVPEFISFEDSDMLLMYDLHERFDPQISQLAPWATQNQHDALADFAYNEGISALRTMLHHGQDQVVKQIPAWCYEHVDGKAVKSEALEARRLKEVALYTTTT